MASSQNTKFAEQEGSNAGVRLLAAQRCVKAERAGERGIFHPLLSAFLFNAVIFPGTKRLLTYLQGLEERLGVPGDFYSLIEKRKSFAPELPALGCLSLLFALNAQNSGAVSAPFLLSVVSVLSAGMSIGVSVEF